LIRPSSAVAILSSFAAARAAVCPPMRERGIFDGRACADEQHRKREAEKDGDPAAFVLPEWMAPPEHGPPCEFVRHR
jgi:hypothetical protein